MRVLMYSVAAVILICVVVPLAQTLTDSNLNIGNDEKIEAIMDAENRFFDDYGVHSSEYRNLSFMDSSSDLVILNYIEKDYLTCNKLNHKYKWIQRGESVVLEMVEQH